LEPEDLSCSGAVFCAPIGRYSDTAQKIAFCGAQSSGFSLSAAVLLRRVCCQSNIFRVSTKT